jgi:SAM-dependent methyltransferase
MSGSDFDQLAETNRLRWNALAAANVVYSQPWLDLTPAIAAARIDSAGLLGDLTGRRVLCLAASAGQQSAAFALLGADVTVFDLSDVQLERDRATAAHYGVEITTVQGDMRDLSALGDASFDVVYQAYSINFVPSAIPVIGEVARVLRPHGIYRLEWHNPFTQLIDQDWTGKGYLLRHPYMDGKDITEVYPNWTLEGNDGASQELPSPHEFVHALSTVVNALAAHSFVILRCTEDNGSDPSAPAGAWPHFMSFAVPYLTLWSQFRPDVRT